jgi:hypothetical protein
VEINAILLVGSAASATGAVAVGVCVGAGRVGVFGAGVAAGRCALTEMAIARTSSALIGNRLCLMILATNYGFAAAGAVAAGCVPAGCVTAAVAGFFALKSLINARVMSRLLEA